MAHAHQYWVPVVGLLIALGFSVWHLRAKVPVWRVIVAQVLAFSIFIIGVNLFALYLRDWHILSPWWRELMGGGRRYPGGIIALLVVMPWVICVLISCKQRLHYADTLAMSLLLFIAISRWVCHINGCCIGGISHLLWGITYPPGSWVYAQQVGEGLIKPGEPHSLPVFPLHTVGALSALAVFGFLYWFNARKAYAGQIVLLYLVLYDGSKALLESWRVPYVLELQVASTLTATVGLLGLLIMAYRRRRNNG